MKKKLIIILSIILSVCACVALVCGCVLSCNSNPKESSPDSSAEQREINITLVRDEATVVRFETITLRAEVEGSDEIVSWTSSDNNVATVDNNGLVYGVNAGSAVIFANVAGKKAKCDLTVTENYNLPIIKFIDNITIEQGKTYASDVAVTFSGKAITEQAKIDCVLADGEDDSVCQVEKNGSALSFTANKTGVAKFYISATYIDRFVNKMVTVNVVEPIINIVADGEMLKIGKNGYQVDLCTMQKDGFVTSIPFTAEVYKGNTVVENAVIVWNFADEGIAKLENNGDTFVITKLAAGETVLNGSYSQDGKTTNISISVTVKKYIEKLDDIPTVEVENLKELDIPHGVSGEVGSVMLDGEDVLSRASGGKMTLNKEKLPKTADKLGMRELVIVTDDVEYRLNVEIYSLIISDKNELLQMRNIARSNGGNTARTGVLDGYFVLDNDIAFNGEYLSLTDSEEMYMAVGSSWRNSSEYGFRGVFDGRGYNIDGMTIKPINPIGSGGFIGYLNDYGIFKNVSFTNAVVQENSGFICALGGGLIENVSVMYKSVGVGNETRNLHNDNPDPRTMGTFFSYFAADKAVVKNCFVSTIGANVYYERNNKVGISNLVLGTKAKNVENFVVVCDNAQADSIFANCGATATAKSFAEVKTSIACQGAFEEFDSDLWIMFDGIPLMRSLANNPAVNVSISFENTENTLYVGQSMNIKVNTPFYTITAELYDGVTFEEGVLSVSPTANGGKVTLIAASILNDTKDTLEITIKQVQQTTVDHERILLEGSSTEIDLSFADTYIHNNVSLYYDGKTLGNGTVANGKLAIDLSEINATGDLTFIAYCDGDTAYKFDVNVKLVTKIIRNADDLKSVRITQDHVNNGRSIYGLYYLANDIDLKGAAVTETLSYAGSIKMWESNFGFRGTFDGQGKTISNFVVNGGGIFGHLGKGAIVRNVKFNNVELSGGYNNGVLAQSAFDCTIEKVDIVIGKYKYSSKTPHSQGFISARYMFRCTIDNVNIDAKNFDVYSVFGHTIIDNNKNKNKCSNVNVKVKSCVTLGYNSDTANDSTMVKQMDGVTVITA